MLQKKLDLTLGLIGLIGMGIVAITAAVDSQATDIVSAIPLQILFATLFIVGYIGARFKEK